MNLLSRFRARQIALRVVARARQVPDRFFVFAGRFHFRQQTGAQQLGQLASVAAIGLDRTAGLHRDERGGDHPAVDPGSRELALQHVTGRARLVAAPQCPLGFALQPTDQPADRPGLVDDAPLEGCDLSRAQQGNRDRVLVYVESDERASVLHRPAPFFVCGSGAARP